LKNTAYTSPCNAKSRGQIFRDRVAFGELDAAHMLAPMPLAATLGIDGLGIPMQAAFSLGLNGSAITIASPLMDAIREHYPQELCTAPVRAHGLKRFLGAHAPRKLVFGCLPLFAAPLSVAGMVAGWWFGVGAGCGNSRHSPAANG